MSTTYTAKISMTLPDNLADIASKIGRALDPDVGGAESFSKRVTGYVDDTPVYGDTLHCETLCTDEFFQNAQVMLSAPEILYQVCLADYEARWSDFTPPTLEDCQAFCAAVVIE